MTPKLLNELSRLYEAEARESKSVSERARLRSVARMISDRARGALSYVNMLRSKWVITAEKETPRTR